MKKIENNKNVIKINIVIKLQLLKSLQLFFDWLVKDINTKIHALTCWKEISHVTKLMLKLSISMARFWKINVRDEILDPRKELFVVPVGFRGYTEPTQHLRIEIMFPAVRAVSNGRICRYKYPGYRRRHTYQGGIRGLRLRYCFPGSRGHFSVRRLCLSPGFPFSSRALRALRGVAVGKGVALKLTNYCVPWSFDDSVLVGTFIAVSCYVPQFISRH